MNQFAVGTAPPLHMRNKFIKELENVPKTTSSEVVIKWNLEDEQFDISSFHPKLVQYKISVEDLEKVAPV